MKSNKPIQAWISPRSESILLPTDCVPIYKFESNGERILNYPEKVEDEMSLIRIVFVVGFLMTMIGVWAFSQVRWQAKIDALRDA